MKHGILTLIIISALFTTACNRYYYKPNGVNAPLFTDGGQAHLNFAASQGSTTTNNTTGRTSIFDIQGSVAPINHLGIIANYTHFSYTTTLPDIPNGDVPANGYIAEAGVGGFYALGGEKIKMVVDLYAGAGTGSITSDVNMKLTRLFLQPGIGMRSPWFDVAFTPRICNLKYSDLNTNGRDSFYLRSQNLIDFNGRRIDQGSYLFFEPCITLRGGYKFAKVQLQGVLSTPPDFVAWNHSPTRFSIGFYFTIEEFIDVIREANKGYK